jgi:hypothetical protein
MLLLDVGLNDSTDVTTNGVPDIVDATSGTWNVYTDTANDANVPINLWNPVGELDVAATQGGGSYADVPQTPSFFDEIGSAINKTLGTLTDTTIKAGTARAQAELGSLIGRSNPPPQNTNTNLQNKTLLSRLSSAQQQSYLGGLTQSIKDKKNWPLVGAMLLGIVIIFRMVG